MALKVDYLKFLIFSSLISFSKYIKLICSKVRYLSVGVSCGIKSKSTLFFLEDCITLLVIQAEFKECSACSRGGGTHESTSTELFASTVN